MSRKRRANFPKTRPRLLVKISLSVSRDGHELMMKQVEERVRKKVSKLQQRIREVEADDKRSDILAKARFSAVQRELTETIKTVRNLLGADLLPMFFSFKLESSRVLDQVCLVVDMDAFYVMCELKERPELIGKPIAVGGNSMLSTSSYEARKFGVRSAMPGFLAKKLCEDLIIIPPNFELYTRVAAQVDLHLFCDSFAEQYHVTRRERFLQCSIHSLCREV